MLFLSHSTTAPATSNGLLGALARASICARTLPMNWQIAAMPHTAVAADLRQALDIHLHFPAQIASYVRDREADYCQKIAKAADDHRFYEEQLALQRQANALIRQWCPEADWDEVDERLILREEVRRLRGLLESAIQTMESRRLKTEAALLRKELEE